MRSSRNQLAAAVLWSGLAVAGLSVAGCGGVSRAIGASKVTPDEFRVVTKAPLVVPPDYALRPPSPGEPRPQELQPESAARVALVGQREAATRTQGENLLTAKAGSERADPLIRYVVDDEFGSLAHKEPSFADRVMFWRKSGDAKKSGAETAAQSGAETPAPVDAATEASRLKSLTGDAPVTIARDPQNGVKLPGL